MAAAKKETVGVSPKAPAATAGALLAPVLAGLVAKAFDIEVDDATVELLLTALFSAAGALAGAVAARPGNVVTDRKPKAGARQVVGREDGYAGIHPIVVVLLAILVFLVLWSLTGSLVIALLALLLLLLLL